MRNLTSALILGMSAFAGPAFAGPLTDIFLGSLEGHGEASWSEGYQDGQVETLIDVVIRMKDGRRYDMESLELDFSGRDILVEAADIRMNPEGDLLLLRADLLSFYGDHDLLENLWTLDVITDACPFTGTTSGIRVEDLGVIIAGPEGVMSDDSRYQIGEFDLSAQVEGSESDCSVSFNFDMNNYQSVMPDGSSQVSEKLNLKFDMPGSLSSLAANQSQDVVFSASANSVSDLISGGATAWHFKEGYVNARFSALGLVPALTLTLKYQDLGYGAEYWMRLWNSFDRMRGDADVTIDRMTVRTSNVLPPEYVTRFTDAGLTTMLLDVASQVKVAGGAVDFSADVGATGLMNAALESRLRLGTYPDQAIQRQATTPVKFDGVLPIYIDDLKYVHSDDGLIDSATNIMGVPVTVRINQIREVQADKLPHVSSVIREIATEAANFASLSYRNPPARLDLLIGEGLNLREALIISDKVPQDILKIFDFAVTSGPEGASE